MDIAGRLRELREYKKLSQVDIEKVPAATLLYLSLRNGNGTAT